MNWVPVSETKPTYKDADEWFNVLWGNSKNGKTTCGAYCSANKLKYYDMWTKIVSPRKKPKKI